MPEARSDFRARPAVPAALARATAAPRQPTRRGPASHGPTSRPTRSIRRWWTCASP